jgi:hypothetical protein
VRRSRDYAPFVAFIPAPTTLPHVDSRTNAASEPRSREKSTMPDADFLSPIREGSDRPVPGARPPIRLVIAYSLRRCPSARLEPGDLRRSGPDLRGFELTHPRGTLAKRLREARGYGEFSDGESARSNSVALYATDCTSRERERRAPCVATSILDRWRGVPYPASLSLAHPTTHCFRSR